MKVGSLCARKCVTVRVTDDLSSAARRMRDEHVGYLVVIGAATDAAASGKSGAPVGVITDRDIVVSVVARGADPAALRVGDVMTKDPVVARADASLEAVAQMMRNNGIRRMPIVDDEGRAYGVVSLDDVLSLLAQQLGDLATLIRNEQRMEQTLRA